MSRSTRIQPRPHRKAAGFSLVEVMVSATVMVIGLLAVSAATTTSALLRQRTTQEQAVFDGLVARLEWARSELFTDSAFHAAAHGALAGGAASYEQSFVLDVNGDGVQDVSFAAGDQATPVITLGVTAPGPTNDPDVLLRVQATATWYGAGGNRTSTVSALIANRTGYSGG